MNTFEFIINKYKINVGKQYIVDIPNMGRNDLAQLFAELGFNEGVEIGVALGEYSEVLLKANPNLHLFSIDPWLSYSDYTEHPEQAEIESVYEVARKRLAPYPNSEIIRDMSNKACEKFADNSLDFVYLDGNHEFFHVVQDLHCWIPKIKMGGIIAGHDYTYFSYKKFNHVRRVVEAYARCYRMQPYFVVGSEEIVQGQIRDRYRSWFWIKDK